MLGKEVSIRKGAVNRLDNKPSQVYFDLDIVDSLPAQFCIKFQNYYCASLVITQLLSNSFKPIMRPLRLMENPVFENDSQSWWHVQSADFNSNFRKDLTMRIFLFQPSSHWAKFEIRNIQIFEFLPERPSVDSRQAFEDTVRTLGQLRAVGQNWKIVTAESTEQSSMKSAPTLLLPFVDSTKRNKRKGDRKKRASVITQQSSQPSDP
eukprot:gene34431-41673_t